MGARGVETLGGQPLVATPPGGLGQILIFEPLYMCCRVHHLKFDEDSFCSF